MKLDNLIQARKTLMSYIDEKISARLAYKMMKLIKLTSDDATFYDDKIKEIIMKYAERDENNEVIADGNNIKLVRGSGEDCQKEINEILEIEVEKPKIVFYLKEFDELKLSAAEMFALDEFITIEEE